MALSAEQKELLIVTITESCIAQHDGHPVSCVRMMADLLLLSKVNQINAAEAMVAAKLATVNTTLATCDAQHATYKTSVQQAAAALTALAAELATL